MFCLLAARHPSHRRAWGVRLELATSLGMQRDRARADQLMGYAATIMKVIVDEVGLPVLQRSLLSAEFSMSSQFSGMGTCEHALKMIQQEARKYKLDMRARCSSVCDIDRHCQQVLLRVTADEDVCVFANMLDYVERGQQISQPSRAKCQFPRISKSMQSARLSETAWCLRHACVCSLPRDTISMSGTSCVDFSNAGSRLGFEGVSGPSTAAWARSSLIIALRIVFVCCMVCVCKQPCQGHTRQQPAFVHENVKRFRARARFLVTCHAILEQVAWPLARRSPARSRCPNLRSRPCGRRVWAVHAQAHLQVWATSGL
jgi:hypothetical protein